mmetsp:Transcript_54913/g.154018  ORF Transcript_54913/g.154018 Transcript_54913/m.154018 type:complete len:84 (-) Transcript_54913:753-1004(-)
MGFADGGGEVAAVGATFGSGLVFCACALAHGGCTGSATCAAQAFKWLGWSALARRILFAPFWSRLETLGTGDARWELPLLGVL